MIFSILADVVLAVIISIIIAIMNVVWIQQKLWLFDPCVFPIQLNIVAALFILPPFDNLLVVHVSYADAISFLKLNRWN